MRFLKFAAIAVAMVLPYQASAVAVTGIFSAIPTPALVPGDTVQGSVVATPHEDFDDATGAFSAASFLYADVTSTINPYLDKLSGPGLSNSIVLHDRINAGPLINMPITKVNNTGSGFMPQLTLHNGDLVRLSVSGLAGRSGNETTFNVVATSSIPVPPAMALLATGIAGFAYVGRRRHRDARVLDHA